MEAVNRKIPANTSNVTPSAPVSTPLRYNTPIVTAIIILIILSAIPMFFSITTFLKMDVPMLLFDKFWFETTGILK